MKRYLLLAFLCWGLPCLTPAVMAQWIESPSETSSPNIESPSIAKPADKVEFLQFSDLTTAHNQVDAFNESLDQLMLQSLNPGGGWLPPTEETTEMAQSFNRNLFVNRPWSYIGVGAGIGREGVSQLGRGSFVANAKVALDSSLSLRPAVWAGDQVAITLPLSYDIQISGSDPFEPARFHPFLGAGVLFTTDADDDTDDNAGDNFGALVMGGLDVRLSDEWVFNTSANFGFLDDRTEIGIVLGVGYVFSGL
ncbi:MAG: hypothetical protein AAGG51_02035 [Cyanobacteria bacterium P01_G01_bin.54]